MQAAYGATLGNAIGVALLNPTSANLESVFSTSGTTGFSPNTGSGLVQNALIDVATGQYVTGVSLAALPTHTPLQGQGVIHRGQSSTLTPGQDTVVLNSEQLHGERHLWGLRRDVDGGRHHHCRRRHHQPNLQHYGHSGPPAFSTSRLSRETAFRAFRLSISSSDVNANGRPNQAFKGDFTATGHEGAWTGLTDSERGRAGATLGRRYLDRWSCNCG